MPRLLVVDDDESVVDAFSRMLRLEGYEVLTALDSQAALRVIDENRPDAVIVDLRMPEVDGIEFVRRLRARDRNASMPVAIITSDYCAPETLANELIELQAEIYLKPLWLPELLSIAQRLLERSK